MESANPPIAVRFGDAYVQTWQEIELLQGAAPEFDREAFLDALVELAPPSGSRPAIQRLDEEAAADPEPLPDRTLGHVERCG